MIEFILLSWLYADPWAQRSVNDASEPRNYKAKFIKTWTIEVILL